VETQGVPPAGTWSIPGSHEIDTAWIPHRRTHSRIPRHELKRLDSPKATLMALITDGF